MILGRLCVSSDFSMFQGVKLLGACSLFDMVARYAKRNKKTIRGHKCVILHNMISFKFLIWGDSQSCLCFKTATSTFALKSTIEWVSAERVNFNCPSSMLVLEPDGNITAASDTNIMSSIACSFWQLLTTMRWVSVYSSKCYLYRGISQNFHFYLNKQYEQDI